MKNKRKIKFNIIGYKSLKTKKIELIISQLILAKSKLVGDEVGEVRNAIDMLKRQLSYEVNKRQRAKKVLVKFTCYWSGYSNNPSAPQRKLGAEYRKIDREVDPKDTKLLLSSFY